MQPDQILAKLRLIFDLPRDVMDRQRRIHEGLAGVDAQMLGDALGGNTPDLSPAQLPQDAHFSSVAMTDNGFRVLLKSPTAALKYCQYSGKVVGQALADSLGLSFSDDPVRVARGVDVALVNQGRTLEISRAALGRKKVTEKLTKLYSEHLETAIDRRSREGRKPGE
jgi:hypothetical protein